MTEKNPVGRPPSITPEILAKLEYAFSIGATDLEACFFAGIGKTTLYQYQEKNPEFAERKEALKDKLVLKSRNVVSEAIESGDKQTAQWYLERKKKDEFSVKTTQENQQLGKDGLPTDLADQMSKMPKDEAYRAMLNGKL